MRIRFDETSKIRIEMVLLAAAMALFGVAGYAYGGQGTDCVPGPAPWMAPICSPVAGKGVTNAEIRAASEAVRKVEAAIAEQNFVLEDLKVERNKYSTPLTSGQLAKLLNDVAYKHRSEGVGLEKKLGGSTCPQPVTNVSVACDILRFPGNVGRDVLQDAEGAANPTWGDAGAADPATFIAPVRTDDPVDPPPGNDHPATAELQTAQLAALAQIIEQLKQVNAQQMQLQTILGQLQTQLANGVKIRW